MKTDYNFPIMKTYNMFIIIQIEYNKTIMKKSINIEI